MNSEPVGQDLTSTPGSEPPEGYASFRPGRIAPLHTIFLVILLLAFSYFSANSQHTFSQKHGRAALYAMTIAWEWVLVGYIVLGLRRSRVSLRELIGGRWRRLAEVGRDVAIGMGFWIGSVLVLGAIGYALGLAKPGEAAAMRERISFLVPHSHSELWLFLGVSATAGFCEEIIFRGYFLRQFAAATRALWIGVVLQGLLFGASHAYEGSKRMLLIAIYGMMFGALAMARKSLRPGMFAHALQDASAGAALYFFYR